MINITEQGNCIRINVRVQPRSAQNKISGEIDGALKIKLTAPPVEGEANQELIKYLAKLLQISKSKISLIQGNTGRNKIIQIEDISKDYLLKKLEL